MIVENLEHIRHQSHLMNEIHGLSELSRNHHFFRKDWQHLHPTCPLNPMQSLLVRTDFPPHQEATHQDSQRSVFEPERTQLKKEEHSKRNTNFVFTSCLALIPSTQSSRIASTHNVICWNAHNDEPVQDGNLPISCAFLFRIVLVKRQYALISIIRKAKSRNKQLTIPIRQGLMTGKRVKKLRGKTRIPYGIMNSNGEKSNGFFNSRLLFFARRYARPEECSTSVERHATISWLVIKHLIFPVGSWTKSVFSRRNCSISRARENVFEKKMSLTQPLLSHAFTVCSPQLEFIAEETLTFQCGNAVGFLNIRTKAQVHCSVNTTVHMYQFGTLLLHFLRASCCWKKDCHLTASQLVSINAWLHVECMAKDPRFFFSDLATNSHFEQSKRDWPEPDFLKLLYPKMEHGWSQSGKAFRVFTWTSFFEMIFEACHQWPSWFSGILWPTFRSYAL